MRILPLLFACVFAVMARDASAQECSGEYGEQSQQRCIDLVYNRISVTQFCEAEDPTGTMNCPAIMNSALPDMREFYAERVRTGWQPPQGGSPWATYSWNSEFTDRPMAKLSTVSAETVDCSDYSTNKPATLLVSCLESDMAIELATQCYLSDTRDGGSVYFRIGEHPAETVLFAVDDKNRTLGIWNHEVALRIALQMIDSESAIFQFTPYDDPLATVRFDLTGFAEKAYPLREACFW